MKKVYGNIQVTSNMKKFDLLNEEGTNKSYISRTYIQPMFVKAKRKGSDIFEDMQRGSAKVTEKLYIEDFVYPSPIFNNEFFGQQNTTAESGYLIQLTEDFEVILYNFCPVPYKPTGVARSLKAKQSTKEVGIDG